METATVYPVGQDCFVKITFPDELDITTMETEKITGRGSFVNAEGEVTNPLIKHNLDDESALKYVLLKGCQFDPEGKSEEQLQNYVPNNFTVFLPNVINPVEKKDTPPILVEIFKDYDEETDTLSQQTEISSDNFVIHYHAFEVLVLEMEETLIKTSNKLVGESKNNTVTFTFTPAAPISYENGQFIIEAPVWAKIYDPESAKMINMYPFWGLETCTADQFNAITQEVIDSILTINYTFYLGIDNEPISISCPGFSNPITPAVQEGYSIKVFNKNYYQTNEALQVSFDGTVLLPSIVPADNFEHTLTNP